MITFSESVISTINDCMTIVIVMVAPKEELGPTVDNIQSMSTIGKSVV